MKRIDGGSGAHSLGPFLQDAREGSEKGFLVFSQFPVKGLWHISSVSPLL